MSGPIEVHEIGLRIAECAWRGNGKGSGQSFVSFVRYPDNLKTLFPQSPSTGISDEQAHSLAIEYLNRFWASNRMCTTIVSNISMDEEQENIYLIRPVLEGGATAGYVTDQGIPAFRCIIKNGFFLAIGFEYGLYSDQAGPDDIVLVGQAYIQTPPALGQIFVKTRPPQSLPSEVLEALQNLKSKRLLVSRKLYEWQSFLDWQMDIVRQRQIGLRYDTVEINESAQHFRFRVSATSEQLKHFKRLNSAVFLAMSLVASQDHQRWAPTENVKGTFMGKLKIRTSKKDINCASGLDEDKELQFIVEAHPEPDTWNKCCESIPTEGFLVNAIYMNIVPLKRQKTAIEKLIKGECLNACLADFLFEANKARTPDTPVIEPVKEDLKYAPKLNKRQRHAVVKALAAPDLFLLQGPPGTGKTDVLAQICHEVIGRGQRVLVVSQANVAVDNILSRLALEPEILPLRISNDSIKAETRSPFSDELVIYHWLGIIQKACTATLGEGEMLAETHENINRIWPCLREMVQEHKNLKKRQTTIQKRLRKTESKSTELTKTLEGLENQVLTCSATLGAFEYIMGKLNGRSPFTDLAEWVHEVAAPVRAEIFKPLAFWRNICSLPEIVQELLSDNQVDNADEEDSYAKDGWAGKVLRWFGQRFLQKKEDKSPPMQEKVELNWAVEWIESIGIFNCLKNLRENLPPLLELCEEGERLCAATMISQVPEQNWVKFTASLHNTLKILDNKVVIKILGLNDIPTSLKPKKRFQKQFAKARIYLQKMLTTIHHAFDSLSEALITVTKSSVKYFENQLAKTAKKIQKTKSAINSLKHKQNEDANTLNDINLQIENMESNWADAITSLPEQLQAQTNKTNLRICQESLDLVNTARASYMTATETQLSEHRLWGPIQSRWIRLLEHPTETDKNSLNPLYLKRCNVVGATCSYSGNYREFLSRKECTQFDIVIIDEVSKATPPELLIPALLGKKLILAGDFKQLPPTFKEGPRQDRSFGELAEIDPAFEQVTRFKNMVTASLFKKLLCDSPDILTQALQKQYRMHPQIMEAIKQFYDNRLECGIEEPDTQCNHGLTIRTHSGQFLSSKNHILWVDTSRDSKGRSAYESTVGTSKVNRTEVDAVIRLVKLLNQAADKTNKESEPLDLGIITFYGPQVGLIRNRLDAIDPADKTHLKIEVSTVDNFQGAERSIVIVSLVRSKKGRIGDFAKTFERINVAMSRAQKLLIILGALKTFANVEVPLPSTDGKIINRRCYGHIINIVKKYGGKRILRDLI